MAKNMANSSTNVTLADGNLPGGERLSGEELWQEYSCRKQMYKNLQKIIL
jgi:hypothetical protein